MANLQRTNVLGVGISAVTLSSAVTEIENWLQTGRRDYVCIRDAHGVILCQDDPELRKIHNEAGLVTPDGMPLVWLSRLNGFRFVSRVYGPDLLLHLCESTTKSGRRHFFYGGNDGVAELLVSKLKARFPSLKIAGTYTPPFRALSAAEEDEVVRMINQSQADIVWVGLSTPKQEKWMAQFRKKLDAGALIGIGAAFDFHAGLKPQAPLWIQRSGFEWLFRLASEPRRLAKRYLHVIPRFIFLNALQKLGLRQYQLTEE